MEKVEKHRDPSRIHCNWHSTTRSSQSNGAFVQSVHPLSRTISLSCWFTLDNFHLSRGELCFMLPSSSALQRRLKAPRQSVCTGTEGNLSDVKSLFSLHTVPRNRHNLSHSPSYRILCNWYLTWRTQMFRTKTVIHRCSGIGSRFSSLPERTVSEVHLRDSRSHCCLVKGARQCEVTLRESKTRLLWIISRYVKREVYYWNLEKRCLSVLLVNRFLPRKLQMKKIAITPGLSTSPHSWVSSIPKA